MFLVVLGTVGAIALALHLLIGRWPLKQLTQRLPELSPVTITLSGTLFGLSVTFLANSVWTTEDRARETVYAEARSIRVMEIYMDSMTGPSRDGLAHLISSYANAVADEWDAMDEPGARQCRRAGAEQHLCRRDQGLFRGRAEPHAAAAASGGAGRAVRRAPAAAFHGAGRGERAGNGCWCRDWACCFW